MLLEAGFAQTAPIRPFKVRRGWRKPGIFGCDEETVRDDTGIIIATAGSEYNQEVGRENFNTKLSKSQFKEYLLDYGSIPIITSGTAGIPLPCRMML